MELYILDDQFRRVTVVDRFESLIWTERFSSEGDFELVVPATRNNRSLFQVDLALAVNTSYRCMIVKQIEDKKDDEGQNLLTISGPSLESILIDRMVKKDLTGTAHEPLGTFTITIASPGIVTKTNHMLNTGDSIYFTTTGALPTGAAADTVFYVIKIDDDTFAISNTLDNAVQGIALNTSGSQSGVHSLFWLNEGVWRLKGTPGDIVRELFQHICVDGALHTGDIIPFITSGNIFPADTIDEPADVLTLDIPPGELYTVIKDICESYDLGFRLIRNFDTSELYFNVFPGSDRTTAQTALPPVVFSPELDNLSDTTTLTSNYDLKNVAYVFAPAGVEIVYSSSASVNTVGFNKKVLYVDASDVNLPAGPELSLELQRIGKEALAKHKSMFAFDGETPQFGSYRHHTDYHLGDIVEMRNVDGVTNNMRITEQITVHDRQGERAYPTLSTELLITPGSWFSWNANQVWDDFDLEVWDDM